MGVASRLQRLYTVLFFTVITLVYLFSRLINLTKLPMFNDEAFYIHWAAIIHDHHGSLWVPLVDGKTPLFYWVNALIIGCFSDPLVSGRVISVASGLITICIFYAAGHFMGRPRAGAVAGILYLLLPWALFNDRLATVDSFHTALVIGCLFMAIRCSYPTIFSPLNALGLGLIMAASFFAKTPTIIFIPLPLLMIILMRKDRFEGATLLKVFLAYTILAIAIIIYLTRDVSMIGEGGSRIFHRSRFFIPMAQLVRFPAEMWVKNLQDLGGYLWSYFSAVLFLLGAISVVVSFLRHRKTTFLIALWTLAPMAALLLLTRETFSRYYLMALTPMLFVIGLEIAHFMEWAKESAEQGKNRVIYKIGAIAALFLFLGFSIPRDLAYMICPTKAQYIDRDRWQYIEGYPSGYGIDRVVNLLKDIAAKGRITVFTTLSWGNPDDAVWNYLYRVPNTQVVECFWWEETPVLPPGKEEIPLINNKFQRQVIGNLKTRDLGLTFFVTRSNPFPRELFEKMNPGAMLIMEAPRPGGGPDKTYLYQLFKPFSP